MEVGSKAESRWRDTVTKVKSVGFFCRHISDKSTQRDNLTEFMNRMKKMKAADRDELDRSMDAYNGEVSPTNIVTCRPRSPVNERRTVPYPEVPTYIRYEIQPGCKCAICEEVFPAFHEHECYPCRICDKVFHKECLEGCGDLTDTDKHNISLAKENIGWSCPECANISLLLTTDEVKKMTYQFENIDVNQDLQISTQEYLMHKSRGQLLPAEVPRLTKEFEILDQNGDGMLDWWEFVNHESKVYLAKKDAYDLVNMLSKKELCAAMATFNMLDLDGDGKVKEYEVKQVFNTWFKQFEKRRPSQCADTFKESDSLQLHADVFTQDLMEADKKAHGMVKWEEFILHQALYILCARPNVRISSKFKSS